MNANSPTLIRWLLSTLPALLMLLLAVAYGTSETVQSRLQAIGERTWPGYSEVRYDVAAPTCDPDGFRVPAGCEGATHDPLRDDDCPTQAAVDAARRECQQRHVAHAAQRELLTPTVRTFRAIDTTLAVFTEAGRAWLRPLLVMLLTLCAATATALDAHIRLRNPTTLLDHRLSSGLQLVVAVAGFASSLAHRKVLIDSQIITAHPWLPLIWAAGFAAMAALIVWSVASPPSHLEPGGRPGQALLTVPLYANLGLAATLWFFVFEQHPAGLAIYLDKLAEQAPLYLQVGLYVWAGMLLKQTLLAGLAFDVVRPWSLPPEVLAAVIVVLSSVPVAWSGASGIFVIAAGGTIYSELRKAGARNQIALATTAMSGSLGVVLSPCLLVVIVAALNKQVTTTALFTVGRSVFLLTAALFVAAMLLRRQEPWRLLSVTAAWAGSERALARLAPYGAMALFVVLFFGLVLETWLNEHSATTILLVVLLGFILLEALRKRPALPRLGEATTETTLHIGALLTLMAFSAAFGGIVERSDVMSMVPTDLGGPIPAMIVLTVALVIIGMLMDPYGAVILVSATLTHVAAHNDIKPIHFWMTVLVAFELGYLTPPVALNQLLTTSIIGRDADDPDLPPNPTFFDRHERYLLPTAVMGISLLIVAFGPLITM